VCSPATPPPDLYPRSLHDALPISPASAAMARSGASSPSEANRRMAASRIRAFVVRSSCAERMFNRLHACSMTFKVLGGKCEALRSEEHTSELQSRFDLVCRLLLDT